MAVATPDLLPALVERYLADGGFERSLREFQSEAHNVLAPLNGRRQQGSESMQSLASLVSEFNRLWVKEQQRATLCQLNPVLKHVLEVVDAHAVTAGNGSTNRQQSDRVPGSVPPTQDGGQQQPAPSEVATIAAASSPPRQHRHHAGGGPISAAADDVTAEDAECWRSLTLGEGAMLITEELPSSSCSESIDSGNREHTSYVQATNPEATALGQIREGGASAIAAGQVRQGGDDTATGPVVAVANVSNGMGAGRKRQRECEQIVESNGGIGDKDTGAAQAMVNPFLNVSMDHVDSFLATLNYDSNE